MGKPKISVIIPVYNAEDTISNCINSVLGQSFTNFEIVTVDDGSTDSSLQILKQLESQYSSIKLTTQSNRGPAAARSNGLSKAQGEWICFVDADDTITHDALHLLASATSAKTDIVLGNGYTLGAERRTYIPIEEFRHFTVRSDGNIGLPWGSLYRSSSIPENVFDVPNDIRVGEDYIFGLRLVFHTNSPVRIVYNKIYDKGPEHISSSFTWTAEYAYKLNILRMEAIPQNQQDLFLKDTIADRIVNLFDITIARPQKDWINSLFYKELIADMKSQNVKFSLRQRLFLSLPSLVLRRLIVQCMHVCNSIVKRN